jgi:outer membrane protein assembly factor BamB
MSPRRRWKSRGSLLGGLALAVSLVSCGGGGSDGGTVSTAPPTIMASLVAFPANGVPPGAISAGRNAVAVVQITDAAGSPVTSASVSANGVALSYSATNAQFEAELTVSPGELVTFQVNVNGRGYSAAMTNFSVYPTITAPVANVTWSTSADNLISWTGTAPNNSAQYLVGVLDTSGNVLWPSGGTFEPVPTNTTSTTVYANSLTAGSQLVLVGIGDVVDFSGAASGSQAVYADFTYSPITVAVPAAIPVSIQIAPASTAVGLGGTTQLIATATMSDSSLVDVTAQATWSSADKSIASIDATGAVHGVAGGSTSVTATFGGLSSAAQIVVFVPNPSPTPPLSQSVTFQVDYAHTGHATVGGSGPSFPPSAHWSVTLSGTNISYPVIADGRVFVATDAPTPGSLYGNALYALDEQTGSIIWGPTPMPGVYSFAALAYDHGILFAVNFDGQLIALDPATGSQLWAVQITGHQVDSAPTAVNGLVYVTGSNGLQAFDETSGAVLFTQNNGASHSSPTVSPDGVFQMNTCWVEKYGLYSGVTLWSFREGCSGGGGSTTVYANGKLYARNVFDSSAGASINPILDAGTGSQLGTFSASTVPAFDATTGYFVDGGQLKAVDLASGSTKWTFAGDGQLQSAPIVIDGYVVTGSVFGTLYVVNGSGQLVWSVATGGSLPHPDEQNEGVPTGFGVGDGYLVVPAGNVLNGWRLVP